MRLVNVICWFIGVYCCVLFVVCLLSLAFAICLLVLFAVCLLVLFAVCLLFVCCLFVVDCR